MNRRIRALCALAVACFAGAAFAQSPYDEINRLRAAPACGAAAARAPLRSHPVLARAAAAHARGADLGASLRQAGYRATRSNVLRVSGNVGPAELVAQLKKRYCAELTDPAVTDIGIHQQPGLMVAVLAAPFAPHVGESQEVAGQKVLALLNRARAFGRTCGSRTFAAALPLRWNATLAQAALRHAEDMARRNYFSHQGLDGSTPAQRVVRAGYAYRSTGENIAAGPATTEEAVADWIKSPPHCAALMEPAFTEMGAGYATNASSDMGVYWAVSFGSPR